MNRAVCSDGPSAFEKKARDLLPAEIRRLEAESAGVVPARGVAAVAGANRQLIGANLKEVLNANQEQQDARLAHAAKDFQQEARDQWNKAIQDQVLQEQAAAGEQDATQQLQQQMDIGQADQRQLEQNFPQALVQIQHDLHPVQQQKHVQGGGSGLTVLRNGESTERLKVLTGGASIEELIEVRVALMKERRLR